MDEGIRRLIELGINASPALAELDKLGKETAKQTEKLDGLQGTLDKFGANIAGALKGLAIIEITKQFVEGFMSMVEAMDAMDEQAQQLGTTVENVQELQYAMSFSGIKADEAVGAMGRFAAKLGDIDDQSNDTSRKLREMGIAAGDDIPTALNKMAETFANAKDGVDKTALSVEIFGRNLGLKMIPFLNEGADGIQRLTDEADTFGVTSTESAKQAAEFNDNLGRLGKAFTEVGRAIVSDALPYLVKFSKWCVDMIGPISKAIDWISTLNEKFSAGAIAARAYSLPQAMDASISATNDSFLSLNKTMTDMRTEQDKKGLVPKTLTEIEKLGKAAQDTARKFALIPEQIAKLKEMQAGESDPLAIKSYANQIASLEKQLEGTSKKAKAARAERIESSDFEKWMDSMLKMQTASEDTGAKIDWLQKHLAALAATGDTTSELFKKWQAELLKIKPDPVAEAFERIAKAAKTADEAPGVIAGLSEKWTEMVAAGKGATEQAKLLRVEILKLEAAKDPVAAVTQELEKMRDETKKNAEAEAIWFQLLSDGAVSMEEFAKGASAHVTAMAKSTDEAKTSWDKLADSIVEMGAKFVTDFVDQWIDGMGKAEASFSDMVTSMLKQLAKLLVQMQTAKLFESFMGTGAGKKATGAAWNAQGIEYMATGGILSSPTFFRTAGRLAVAGEAGPEAVAPLKRGADGNLGVAASPTNIEINNYSSSKVETETSNQLDGSKLVRITIQQEVKAMMANGTFDRSMRSNYGLTRQPSV